jgi:hypothetical protein
MLPLHKRRTQFRYARIEFDLDISHGGATRWLVVRCKHVFTAEQHRPSESRVPAGTMSELGNRRRKGTSR